VDSDYSNRDEPIVPGNCDVFSNLEVELLLKADGTLITYMDAPKHNIFE
jgi:hypothetical protein